MTSEFQFLPNLSDEEYGALKSDIAKRGVQVPIEFDEQGNVLDGHHRLKACQELGIKDYPSIIRIGMSEEEKFEHVLALNLDRRHLTREQRDELILTLRKRGYSTRQIAEMLGISDITVRRILSGATFVAPDNPEQNEESNSPNGDFDLPERIIGKDGKSYPARRPAIIAKNQREAKTAINILADMPPELLPDYPTDVKQTAQLNREIKKNDAINFRKEIAAKTADIPCENITNMRFQDAVIEPGSIDLILTDPPYGIEYKQSWIDLADFAERILKPSGFLISYFGQINLPLYMSILNEKLNYYWTIALIHSGNKQLINARDVFCGWKPILIYQKPPFAKIPERIEDIIIGSGREKEMHDWQQGLSEIEPLISAFTIEGEVILDPFAGSGTTIIAALQNNRKAMGFECEYDTYLIAKLRIEEYKNGR